ncbi:MAG: tRNA (adenosine(37)-N6)-threonylcarbamoyltransferase complex dimerization subunit type 1 TsaB [Gemmatimonadales bacterium]
MWLAIDTSADQAAVAVGDASGPRAERSLRGGRDHAKALLPMIETVLGEAGTTLDQLDGILLADGPGSFTGLRVGASVVKALVAARSIEVRTAPALLLLAAGALPPHAGPVLAVSDALRAEVYAAAYDVQETTIRVLSAPAAVPIGEAAALVAPGAALVGTAPEAVLVQIAKAIGGHRLAPPASTAITLLELLDRAGGLTPVKDLGRWEPLYGRPAEAQRKWEEAHGRPLPDPARDAG